MFTNEQAGGAIELQTTHPCKQTSEVSVVGFGQYFPDINETKLLYYIFIQRDKINGK